MAKNEITFEACLKSTTPQSKPIKFGAEGEGEIILETDASQMAKVVSLLTLLQQTFTVTIKPRR